MFKKKFVPRKLPNHIGFILDGNGRWAQQRGLPRNMGHREGILAVKRVADALLKYEIPYASMFAFSTENWKRSEEEIDGIFSLIKEFFNENIDTFQKKNIKVNIFGDITPFPDELKEIFNEVVEKTKENSKLQLNMCLNYGGKADIVQAVNKLIKEGKKEVTEEDINSNLYSQNQPNLDFVIRTSGEQRLSNFMLYQLAYAELYFPKTYWPDFNEKEVIKALKVFEKRERRYGGN